MASSTRAGMEPVEQKIADLRQKVEALMTEQVTPALSGAAGRAEEMAGRVAGMTRREVEQVGEMVRGRPFAAIAVAAVAGFVIGRLLSR